MSFIQIIEFRTDDLEQVRAVSDEWRTATEGVRTLRKEIVAADRNEPGRYLILAFFDSHEAAMRNSALPETQEAAAKVQALVTSDVTYRDLDVREGR